MLMITSPHSGESIPKETPWLHNVDKMVLLTDVDRYVDELYKPTCTHLNIPMVAMDTHRYVVDLNRLPEDVSSETVEGIPLSSKKKFVSELHWKKTTQGYELFNQPIPLSVHKKLLELYYFPFHEKVQKMEAALYKKGTCPPRYHFDVHSMPSVATATHKDAGKKRPDVVISDCEGKSCSTEFKDITLKEFQDAGFQVSYNWPYLGGRMTEQYGKPAEDKHSIQIELNRALYMDEKTREKNQNFQNLQEQLEKVLRNILQKLS